MPKDKYLTPADRLAYIRLLTRFGREKLSKELAIPLGTLRKWESGERTLTEESIRRCIDAYKSVGVVVSKEWLLKGEGYGPIVKNGENEVPTDYNKLSAYLKLSNDGTDTFFSYLDKNEKFQFVSTKYDKIFKKPPEEIIGKNLKSLIGLESYNLQKPYLNRAYSGKEVDFEYPWKDNGIYRYLRLYYIPNFEVDGEVKGIFSFLEEDESVSEIKASCLVIKARPDIDEILPYVEDQAPGYDRDLYFGILDSVKHSFESYKVDYNLEELTKVAFNVYLHAFSNKRKISIQYLDKIIKVGIRAGVLHCS